MIARILHRSRRRAPRWAVMHRVVRVLWNHLSAPHRPPDFSVCDEGSCWNPRQNDKDRTDQGTSART